MLINLISRKVAKEEKWKGVAAKNESQLERLKDFLQLSGSNSFNLR